MKERPSLFKGIMVRPILADTKTQTRRIMKPQPEKSEHPPPSYLPYLTGWQWPSAAARSMVDLHDVSGCCPYGSKAAGDRLRVRETWRTEELPDGTDGIRFAADGAFVPIENTAAAADQWVIAHDNGKHGQKWRPSIFLPTWASRIRLEITDVRVERLRDISKEDAIAEGLTALTKDGTTVKYGIPDRDGWPGNDDDGWHWHEWDKDPREAYFRLWGKINGRESLAANPWIWAISFRRVQP